MCGEPTKLKAMKRTFILLTIILKCAGAFGQSFDGTWNGVLAFGQQPLPMSFDIDGSRATLLSPSQSDMRISATSVEYPAADGIVIRIEQLRITYSGTLTASNKIEGIFEQNGIGIPLLLERGEPQGINRPQEPQPPYPYIEEEVEFASVGEGVTLYGTLTLPDDNELHPGVVLVTGSGTQNRDEEAFGHKPFKVIADWLTRHGIVVLRYDDREYSTLRYEGATTQDYARDAAGAVEYLRTRSEVDTSRIGVIGHSEGGTIAFMCGAADPEIAFIVSLAGMTTTGKECTLSQNMVVLRNEGTDEATAENICNAIGSVIDTVIVMSPEQIRAESEQIADRAASDIENQEMRTAFRKNIATTLGSLNEWVLYFWGYDPAESISRIRCRVLALNGDKDIQVDAERNLGRLLEFPNLEGLLTVRKFPNLNHMFQHCESGSVSEYAAIAETFSEDVLAEIADWINNI